MKMILWTTFEILVNFYQGMVLTYFMRRFLQPRFNKRLACILYLSFSFIFAVAICLENYLGPLQLFGGFKPYYAIVYIVVLLLYALCSLKGSLPKKLFAATFANVIMLLSSALCGNIAAIIFDEEFASLLYTPGIERFLVIIATQLSVFYLVFVSLHLMMQDDKNVNLSRFEWAIITAVLCISLLFGTYINFIAMGKKDKIRLFSLIVFACVILTNIIVCYLLTQLSAKRQFESEVALLKKTREYNSQYIEALLSDQDAVRKLRHDYKNVFITVLALLESNNLNELKHYASEMIGAINETEIFVRTNNAVANAVINAKLSIAKSLGIESECLVMSNITGIDDIDICRLLSNMLDNAITACQSSNAQSRRINLSIRADKSSYIFTVKNTIDASVIQYNPKLVSTKKDKSEHGFGIKIIKDISKKYGGRSDFYEESGMFCCCVTLANINKFKE